MNAKGQRAGGGGGKRGTHIVIKAHKIMKEKGKSHLHKSCCSSLCLLKNRLTSPSANTAKGQYPEYSVKNGRNDFYN